MRNTFASNSLSNISFTIHPADLIKTEPKKKTATKKKTEPKKKASKKKASKKKSTKKKSTKKKSKKKSTKKKSKESSELQGGSSSLTNLSKSMLRRF